MNKDETLEESEFRLDQAELEDAPTPRYNRDLLEIVRNKRLALLEDPIVYAMSAGVIQEYGIQQDPQDPSKTLGSLASILQSRDADSKYLKNFFGVESPNITRQEAGMVADSILKLPQVGPSELGLLSNIHPQRHSEILDQVSARNPSLGFALSVGRGDPMSAELMLKGDRKIDSSVLKQNEKQLNDLKTKLFSGMNTIPDDYKNQVLRGALAYSMETGLDSLSLEKQAERLSRVVEIGSSVERYKIVLPSQFNSQYEFMDFVKSTSVNQLLDSTGDVPAFSDGSSALYNFSSEFADPDGSPYADDSETDTIEDLINKSKLVSVGDGKFEIHTFGQPLKSSKNLNNNFVFDISKIKSIIDSRTQEAAEFKLDQAELDEPEETQEEAEFRMDQAELQD